MFVQTFSRGALLRLTDAPEHARALQAVRQERAHQLDLGFDAAHDDLHRGQELAYASVAYLLQYVDPGGNPAARAWPWSEEQGKFRPREAALGNLVAGVALGLAELERILREEQAPFGADVALPLPADPSSRKYEPLPEWFNNAETKVLTPEELAVLPEYSTTFPDSYKRPISEGGRPWKRNLNVGGYFGPPSMEVWAYCEYGPHENPGLLAILTKRVVLAGEAAAA